jgi:hypothetical protein
VRSRDGFRQPKSSAKLLVFEVSYRSSLLGLYNVDIAIVIHIDTSSVVVTVRLIFLLSSLHEELVSYDLEGLKENHTWRSTQLLRCTLSALSPTIRGVSNSYATNKRACE